jgi:hypothetical protein
MHRFLSSSDRIAGRLYHRVLAIALMIPTLGALSLGLWSLRADGITVVSAAFLCGAFVFASIARSLWRSSATLSETLSQGGDSVSA